MTPNPEPREERVAGLVGALRLTAQPFPSSIDAWLLITVEALAGLEWSGADGFCPKCGANLLQPFGHDDTCTVGLAAEAWRRVTNE